MTLPEQIKELRKKHKLTQEQLATQVGCSLATYNNFERGKGNISLELLERMAEVLQVEVRLGYPDITCRCKAKIIDDDVHYFNSETEEGEEYGGVSTECVNCGADYTTMQWGPFIDIQEAKRCLQNYIDTKKEA
jgi:transcriptional regulator with XRE-family HTH domain